MESQNIIHIQIYLIRILSKMMFHIIHIFMPKQLMNIVRIVI
jgi:hypothetical protein